MAVLFLLAPSRLWLQAAHLVAGQPFAPGQGSTLPFAAALLTMGPAVGAVLLAACVVAVRSSDASATRE